MRLVFAFAIVVALLATAVLWPAEDEPLTLHVFCLPDRQCPPCAHFHRDATASPLKETLASLPVYHHASTDGPTWSVDRYPTFVMARGMSQVRRLVGYTSPASVVGFVEGKP